MLYLVGVQLLQFLHFDKTLQNQETPQAKYAKPSSITEQYICFIYSQLTRVGVVDVIVAFVLFDNPVIAKPQSVPKCQINGKFRKQSPKL